MTDSFNEVMSRLKAGDQDAARVVFDRFTGRLIAMVRSRIPNQVAAKFDADDVIQSAYRSFFIHQREGQYDWLEGWGSLWSLLAQIAARKCGRKLGYFHAAKRNATREVTVEFSGDSDASDWEAIANGPSPEEAAMLNDIVERLMRQLEPHERTFLQMALQGESTARIAEATGYGEWMVQRFLRRLKDRLNRMNEEGSED